jgi:hypothetical protein
MENSVDPRCCAAWFPRRERFLSNGRGNLPGVTAEGSRRNPGSERFQRRAAAAEINGRQVNEAIEPRGWTRGSAVFVCECGHLGCSETVRIGILDYEAVRTSFDRFLLVPGHEIEEVDKVVERHEGYLVVVKRRSEAREMARASDKRSP